MQIYLPRLLLTCILSSIALTIASVAKAAKPKSPYPTTQIPCPVALDTQEVEGKTVVCGVLTVPEDYTKPSGRQVDITYALLRSQSLSPQPDPMIVLHGGPGATDITSLKAWTRLYAPQRQTRDVILFDQRGSRFSGDLACTPTFIALENITEKKFGDELAKKLAEFTAKFRAVGSVDPNTLATHSLCSRLLSAHGHDLSQYNSENNARDVVSLATALGYGKVNLYGISYGTFLAMQVMRDHPQQLRSVILDSTLPPNVSKYEVGVGDYETAMLNLIEDCQKDLACNAAYPNLQARIEPLLEALNKKPIPVSPPAPGQPKLPFDTVKGDVLNVLLDKANGDNRYSRYLPLIVSELEKRVTTTLIGVTTKKLFTEPAPPNPISQPQKLLEDADKLRAQAKKLLEEKAQYAETQRPSSRWVKQVLDTIETLPETDRLRARADFYAVGYQPGLPRDAKTLNAYISETFPESRRRSLSQLLQTMTSAEVRHVYEIIGTLFRSALPDETVANFGAVFSFDCQDAVPFSDPAKLDTTFKQLKMPSLVGDRYLAAQQVFAICPVWFSKQPPARTHGVLKSDIPTLVLQGRNDIQTPTAVGKQAMVGLANGTYLEFPNAGHAVLLFSDCARDIGATFANNPTRPPDASCIKDLKTQFVLPRGN